MSMPKFEHIHPPITFKEAINMILTSIAMEELGLSHILNAEAEKMKYVLGTLKGSSKKEVTTEEILAVNKSIKALVDSVMNNQILLKSKMESALNALEEDKDCKPGPTGPTGPPGPTGPSGSCSICKAACFRGRAEQCWFEGKPLLWLHTDCSKRCPLYVSSDGKRITLEGDRCYAVSFSLTLCTDRKDIKNVSIGVQTVEFGKRTDKFVYFAPVTYANTPFTVSAGGIYVSTFGNYSDSELMLTLLSPDAVKVKQSSISIIEA